MSPSFFQTLARRSSNSPAYIGSSSMAKTGFVLAFLVASAAVVLGVAAQAVEPAQLAPAAAQATADKVPLGQALLTVGLFLISGTGIALINVILKLRTAALGVVDSRIDAKKLADDKARNGGLPQPLVTTQENPPVGSAEFREHRERNTKAHTDIFEAIRATDAALKTELKHENEKLMERMEEGFAELREADSHSFEKISSELRALTGLIGELRGTVEQMARQQTARK
jgi:hypothetical protein